MAKNKHCFGKFLAFTATVTAVGGACYVFRDKIKKCPLYKATVDKAYGLYDKWRERATEDEDDFEDFSFDDEDDFEDVFSDDDKTGREYTSITINPKEEPEADNRSIDTASTEEVPDPNDSVIPIIDFGSKETDSSSIPASDATEKTISTETDSSVTDEPEVTGYEYEGLSDVSEDPDVLEEQDKLDF